MAVVIAFTAANLASDWIPSLERKANAKAIGHLVFFSKPENEKINRTLQKLNTDAKLVRSISGAGDGAIRTEALALTHYLREEFSGALRAAVALSAVTSVDIAL